MALTPERWTQAVDRWIADHPVRPEPFADTYAYDYRAEQDYPFVTVYDAAPPFSVVERHLRYREAFCRYGDESWPEPRPLRRARVAPATRPYDAEVIARYLPSGYRVLETHEDDGYLIIEGEDHAGWTLDDYVIPRLASGLFVAREITEGEDNA